MASDTTTDSEAPGCMGRANDTAKNGCGCLGIGIALLVGVQLVRWVIGAIGDAFFYYSFTGWTLLISGGALLVGGIVGFFVTANSSSGLSTRLRRKTAGKMALAFGALCLVTVIGMTLRPSSVHVTEEVEPQGGTLGPFEVPHDDVQMGVRVHQRIESGGRTFQRWSFITAELLDEDKNYLAGFGGDVWREAGYDEGEHWEEDDEEYQTTLHLPSAGTYYVRLQTEANVGASNLGPIAFEMYERARWGTPIPFRWAAYVAFFLGALLYIPQWFRRSSLLRRHLNDGGKVRFDGQTWRPAETVEYRYDGWRATEWILHPTGPGAKRPRYLEYEYEPDSNWKNWGVSRPVALDDLQCSNSGGVDMTVLQYAAEYDALPNAVTVDGRRYDLEDSGKGRRQGGESFRYHTYEDEEERFVSIEGRPGDELEAVVGGPLSVSAITFVLEEDEEQPAGVNEL